MQNIAFVDGVEMVLNKVNLKFDHELKTRNKGHPYWTISECPKSVINDPL